MKLNLCCVYCALLFVSCISSCILFLLVAAENGVVLGSGSPTTITTGNASTEVTEQSVTADSKPEPNEPGEMNSELLKDEHTVKEIHSSIEDLSVSREQPVSSEERLQRDPVLPFQQQPSVSNEISDSGQAAVVFTLVDTATSELQQKVAASSSVPSTAKRTENKTVPLAVPVPLPSESDAPGVVNASQQYIVRAQPKQVDAKSDTQLPPPKQDDVDQQPPLPEAEQNDTTLQPPAPPPPPQQADTSASQEDIPSFSEWAQKQLAEAEKKRGENTTGGSGVISGSGLKMRNKNYASPDCGAKVVAANPEAVSAGAVLSPSRDEYLLNTCNSRIWFVVELCEAIQPRKIELANFELFSSPPRDFSVWLSDRMPTRDWTSAGKYTAQDERTIQAFNLDMPPAFGKYVKVEIHSHYGAEHYCPVSLFRVYGTSEFEVLDTVDEVHHTTDDDDDDLMMGDSGEAPKNLFGSARDAVLSIVKKAAEVLVKTPEGEEQSNLNETVSNVTAKVKSEDCITPSYIVVCDNCSDELFHRVYNLLSCHGSDLERLLSDTFVCSAIKNSELCTGLGLDLKSGHAGAPYPLRQATSLHSEPHPIEYLQTLLKPETLAAMCNILAITQKKVAHNVTYPHETNETGAETASDNVEPPLLIQPESTCSVDVTSSSSSPSPSGTSDFSTTLPYSGVDHGQTLPGQIRPTKTLTKEENLSANVEVVNHHNATASGMNHGTEKLHTVVSPTQTVAVNVSEGVENNSATVDSPLTVMDLPEDTTVDSLSLDSLFSELEEAVVDTNNGRPATQHVTPPQLVQKESVFVRLANRIKALERNMSLSGQYLEELSRRYKRQVEEMQKALAGAMEERKRGEEREEKRKEQLSHLTEQVAALTLAVETLLNERDSWQHKASVLGQHGVIILVEVIVFAIVLCVCRWLPEVEVSRRKFSVAWPRSRVPPERRKSVDGVTEHLPPRTKKRRPSEEALRISGSTHQELLISDNIRQNQIAKNENRRRRRKRKELAAKLTGLEMEPVKRPLLERNSAENILAPWWDEDVTVSSPSTPSLQTQLTTVSAPAYFQTALSHRQERISRVPSSEVSIDNVKEQKQTFLPIKKSGPFKKIVKKFF